MKTMRTLYLFFISIMFIVHSSYGEQGTWTVKADINNSERAAAVAFSIGSKGYVGTGCTEVNNAIVRFNDFWEYDPANNTWSQKVSFPGTARTAAVGFSIGNKGYIGTGYTGTANKNDFWEYDPANNTWLQKNNFPGSARASATGFSIGTKGYLGTGYDGTHRLKDFWEYDPVNDSWLQKADAGDSCRAGAGGFSIGGKGYIGAGSYNPSAAAKDFWEYDPNNDTWMKKANFPGTPRIYARGFSIGTKGYMGTGSDDANFEAKGDFCEYDPASNTWTLKPDVGGPARREAIAFSIGGKGYFGMGRSYYNLSNGVYTYYGDFWEYSPTSTGIDNIEPSSLFSVYPNPCNGNTTVRLDKKLNDAAIRLINIAGQTVIQETKVEEDHFTFDISDQPNGIYFVEVKDKEKISRVKLVKN